MLEISDYLIGVIETDVTLKGYLGGTADDSRVYPWDTPYQIIYSDSLKAALFWRNNQNPVPVNFSYPAQIGNFYYYFQVVSSDKSLANQIEERLIALLAPVTNSGFKTTHYRVGFVLNNGVGEGSNEGTTKAPLYSRVISLMLKEVFTRP